MLKLKKVAVTGGLSCGKSSVLNLFKELGAHVVSADEIVHQLLSPETHIGQEVIKLIGFDIVKKGRIDRAAIAKKVFDQPELLKSLEKILHPAVYDAIESQFERLKSEGKTGLFVVEIPLLFESGNGRDFDATVSITSSEALSIERFKKATSYGEEEFHKRMSQQMDPKEKARRATYVIRNEGSWEDLRREVKNIYNLLTT